MKKTVLFDFDGVIADTEMKSLAYIEKLFFHEVLKINKAHSFGRNTKGVCLFVFGGNRKFKKINSI